MITLFGTSISNYYCTAKVALLEKGLAFEEVNVGPSQNPEILAANPMGKVPYLEVDGRFLSETNVMFDYFEDISPQPPLYPQDPWLRAKAKELSRVVELYFDAPVRRNIDAVYFGGDVDPVTATAVKPELDKGVRTLKALGQFSPFIAGDMFTFADIDAYFQIRFTQLHTRTVYDWDIAEDVPGLHTYLDMLFERPHINAVDTVMQRDFAAFTNK